MCLHANISEYQKSALTIPVKNTHTLLLSLTHTHTRHTPPLPSSIHPPNLLPPLFPLAHTSHPPLPTLLSPFLSPTYLPFFRLLALVSAPFGHLRSHSFTYVRWLTHKCETTFSFTCDICIHVWIRIYAHMCLCAHMCMYVYVYICVYMYVHICMYIWMYIYVHTHTYTRI